MLTNNSLQAQRYFSMGTTLVGVLLALGCESKPIGDDCVETVESFAVIGAGGAGIETDFGLLPPLERASGDLSWSDSVAREPTEWELSLSASGQVDHITYDSEEADFCPDDYFVADAQLTFTSIDGGLDETVSGRLAQFEEDYAEFTGELEVAALVGGVRADLPDGAVVKFRTKVEAGVASGAIWYIEEGSGDEEGSGSATSVRIAGF